MSRSTTNLQLRLPLDMHAALGSLAARRGQSAAAVARQAIAKEIGQAAISDGADAVRPMLKSVVAREIADTNAVTIRVAYETILGVELLTDILRKYAKSHEELETCVSYARARAIMRLREPFSTSEEEAELDQFIAQYEADEQE